ncbi:hypothetical protein HML84_11280 [Alcanivorax sp. IO_7]|nr:hypothetical protein HML84_11280 [Alcanivorax sp. IO_7]
MTDGHFDNLADLPDRRDQSRVEIVSGGDVIFEKDSSPRPPAARSPWPPRIGCAWKTVPKWMSPVPWACAWPWKPTTSW